MAAQSRPRPRDLLLALSRQLRRSRSAWCVSEIMRSRTSQGSIAWILSLLILPFPMTLRLRDLRAEAVRRLCGGADPFRPRAAQGARGQDQDPRPARRPRSGRCSPTSRSCPFLKGNDVELLIDGEATFDSIFAGISRRREGAADPVLHHPGRRARDASSPTRLIERAKAGVKIYLLYDDVGSLLAAARLQGAAARCGHPHPRLQPPPPVPALPRPDPHPVSQPSQDRRGRRQGGLDRRAQCRRRVYGPLEAVRALARHACPHQGAGGAGRRAELPRGLAVGDGRGADRACRPRPRSRATSRC